MTTGFLADVSFNQSPAFGDVDLVGSTALTDRARAR